MSSSDPDGPALGHADTVTPGLADTATPDRAADPVDGRGLASSGSAAEGQRGSIDAVHVARPEADGLARAVARTRIANKLFAKDDQVHVGRYHLLEMVGAGGMGVVWGAWDPELERRVAIKLVKATLPAARDRIQLEGQALARLAHPNVVTVHDVGVLDDQVYIVMEWVRGQNLRAYGRTARSLRELLAVYRAAGDGLAAAHAAGLIHRDFKPDNAIRGDDGRVRVLDFGLARDDVRPSDSARSSDLTRGAGTPRYMPPEQAAGGALTPAVDQYAFCVALREAVVGRNADGRDADVPGWIAAICTRGTAREPAERFGSMAELLRALARDPATIWRRRAIVGGALAATAAAFVIGSLRAAGSAVEPCTGSRGELAAALGPPARAAMVAHLATLGPYGAAEAPRLGDELTAYGERWIAAHHAACIASERGELTSQIYERNLGCLARARVGLATAVDLLGRVAADRLSDAIVATRGLPDTARCLTETQASAVEPPAPELAPRAAALGNAVARLRVLAQAGDPSVEAAARVVASEAEQLGYLPLVARAYLVQGLDCLVRGDAGAGLPLLDRAATTALDGGDQVVFVEAYARAIFAIATTPREGLPAGAPDALGAIPYVEHLARRLGAAASFERPLLFNNIGVSRMSAGDQAGARQWFSQALDEPRTREGDVELVSAVGNLALIADPAERDRLFARERDTLTALLGPNHIRTLETRYKSAVFVARPDEAAAQIRAICDRAQTYHAKESADMISRCAYELGWLAEERGDLVEAGAAMRRVANNRAPLAGAYLAALDGRLADAIDQARRAAQGLQAQWWTKLYAGDGFLFAALCAERLHHAADAIGNARAALALYDQLTVIKQAPYYLRRVARTRALLARLVPRPEAQRLAGEAAAWYRAAGGYDATVAQLDALAR